jgi:hypothetical protein
MMALAIGGLPSVSQSGAEAMNATSIYTAYFFLAAFFGLWCGSIWKSRGEDWLVGFIVGFFFQAFGLLYTWLIIGRRPARRPPS